MAADILWWRQVDFNAIADKTGAASGASIKKTLQNLVKNRKTLKMDRGKVKTKGRKRAAGSGSDDSGDEAINDGAGGLNAGFVPFPYLEMV